VVERHKAELIAFWSVGPLLEMAYSHHNIRLGNEGEMDQLDSICINNDNARESGTYSVGLIDTSGYCEPEVLARIILAESPEAVEAFGSLEEMVEYIREAAAANYIFGSLKTM
jgi:hypothetical protein